MLMGALILYTAAIAVNPGLCPFTAGCRTPTPPPLPCVRGTGGHRHQVSGVYSMMRLYRNVFGFDPRMGQVMLIWAWPR